MNCAICGNVLRGPIGALCGSCRVGYVSVTSESESPAMRAARRLLEEREAEARSTRIGEENRAELDRLREALGREGFEEAMFRGVDGN